jgi:F0F1-type ATP synthase assembly protein I
VQAAALDGCAAWLDREGRDVSALGASVRTGFREPAVTDDDRSDDERARLRGSRLAGALYSMMGTLGLGVGIGWALDRKLGTSPGWTIGLSMAGLLIGFYLLIRETMR